MELINDVIRHQDHLGELDLIAVDVNWDPFLKLIYRRWILPSLFSPAWDASFCTRDNEGVSKQKTMNDCSLFSQGTSQIWNSLQVNKLQDTRGSPSWTKPFLTRQKQSDPFAQRHREFGCMMCCYWHLQTLSHFGFSITVMEGIFFINR